MFRTLALLIITGLAAGLGGCATIVHSGNRTIEVNSSPPGATVTIYDRANLFVSTNTTPFVAHLDPKFGYFKSQNYRLVFELKGHAKAEATLTSSVSGWYFGNLLIGGLLGMLIIDPVTGAMYNLEPQKIEQTLSPSQAQVIRSRQGILVVMVDEATASERAQMTRVNAP